MCPVFLGAFEKGVGDANFFDESHRMASASGRSEDL